MSVEVCPAVSAPGVYASGNSTHQTTFGFLGYPWNIHWISSQKRYPKKASHGYSVDIPLTICRSYLYPIPKQCVVGISCSCLL